MEQEFKKTKHKFNRFLRILGPGLITGAADDDPSGIATYSQTGAQFGFGQLWTVIFMYPLMVAVQEACARIGAVTGRGIASVVRENYSKKLLYFFVGLVFVANTINIGADIGAMAAAAQLIIPIPFILLTLFFTVSMLLLEIFTTYKTYAKILKWLVLTLLAYPIAAFIAVHDWKQVGIATFVPHVQFSSSFLFIITGVIGTTISPYMFFWQASEEVEEEIEDKQLSQAGAVPKINKQYIKGMRIDNAIGMLFSQITTWFIIVLAASVFFSHRMTNITTAADAAKALEPLVANFPNAGLISKVIFGIGIVGLGFLAIPVLAGSASYALSEAFRWREGLYLKLDQAHGFYGVITIATVIGLGINFVGIDPIKALIFTAVFNGVASVPLIFLITKISSSQKIMGKYTSGFWSKIGLWTTFAAVSLSVILMFLSFVRK